MECARNGEGSGWDTVRRGQREEGEEVEVERNRGTHMMDCRRTKASGLHGFKHFLSL